MIKIRECAQWSPEEFYVLRYDFAYIDPASLRRVQFGVECWAKDETQAQRDQQIVPMARASIERILKRKCGLKRAEENQIELPLPRAVPARYV